MKLVKALKVKNRLIGEMNRLRAIFQRENSRPVGSSIVDVKQIELEMAKVMAKLVALKTAITKANIGIYEKICKMDELKSMKSFYGGLTTTHGKIRDSYSDNNSYTEYEAYIKREMVDDIQKAYQNDIDILQDEIDEYNATTSVDIDESMLK